MPLPRQVKTAASRILLGMAAETSAASRLDPEHVPIHLNSELVIPTGGTAVLAVPELRYGFPSHVLCAMNLSSTSDFRLNKRGFTGRRQACEEGGRAAPGIAQTPSPQSYWAQL